nr:hypothetical protein [Tanacetum cinerariifolium]
MNDWEILFQLMLDESHNPPPCVDLHVLAFIALDAVVSIGTPSSTTIDQDAPPTSTSQTSLKTPSLVLPLGVEEADHDIKVTHMANNPVVEFLILEPSSKESSTQFVIPNHVHSINQPPKHINKWTKDHPIDNVIGDPSRPDSTRQQLQDEALLYVHQVFTGQIRPKKSKGKGSQRNKTVDDSWETIDGSEESEPEPEPESLKRKTSSKRRVKKKVTLSADDNIISDDPNTALEIGKSISQTEAEEAEAARQVHATYARIVTESVPEPIRRRKLGKVTFDPPKKLKGVSSITPKEHEAADIMQTLKEIKKTSKRQPITGGSSKGTGTIPRVPNESPVVSATSSEGTGTKPRVLDEEKDVIEENVILEWGSERESEYSEEDKLDDEEKDDKDGDADDEDDETESDKDDMYKYKIHVRKDEDEEMINAQVKDSNKRDEEVTDAAKADAKMTLELRVSKLENNEPNLKKIDLFTEALAALKTQVSSVVDNYLRFKDSLIMGDEHLDTIPKNESNEFIKSSVKNLVPNPSDYEDLSNIGIECDVPVCDDFTTFSNSLFDADENFSSSDDESFSDEDWFSGFFLKY